MTKEIQKILKEALEKITPEKKEIELMENSLNEFLEKTKKRIKKLKINAEIFVGGSFSKKTFVKKESYDVDLFLRFDKKYPEKDYSKLSKKILRFTKRKSIVHGSRDYFKIKITSWFYLEVIPVKKITKSEEAVNITDLSYSHVNYLNKKIKSEKILEQIKLAKSFASASKTYGAESYVHGFSGYALELLIYHYKTFEKFLKAMVKQKEKTIIDIEKYYKKGNVLLDMNASKLESPIILIDPTYKRRNVIAALSKETFEKFQKQAKAFLKNPSIKFFEQKKLNINKIKEQAKKEKYEFILIKTKTKKQAGDIAGTKLLKFHKHLILELSKYFEIEKTDFEYLEEKLGQGYFILTPKKEILFSGPESKDKKHAEKFRLEHKKSFVKKGRLYSKEKINFTPKEFLKKWSFKNKRKIKEMYISGIKVY